MHRKVDTPRKTSKTTPRKLTTAEQRTQGLAMRLAGYTFEQIGERLGITDSAAHKLITKALDEAAAVNADQATALRQLEIERLDRAQVAIEAQVRNGHLGAIDRWIRLGERRAKLLGLDAPTRAITFDMTGATDEQLERIARGEDPMKVMGR